MEEALEPLLLQMTKGYMNFSPSCEAYYEIRYRLRIKRVESYEISKGRKGEPPATFSVYQKIQDKKLL